jgi:hypothetical protein
VKQPIVLALCLAALCCVHPLGAQQKSDDHRAGESFRQAQAAFARKEFAAAAAAFEQAARFRPHPAPLLNAAEAWELAEELARAAENCDAVLAMPGLEQTFEKEARERLAKLLPKVATLRVTAPRGGLVSVDGGPPSVIPAVRRLLPGSHQVVLTRPSSGERRELVLELKAGETHALAEPASRAQPPPTENSVPPVIREPRPEREEPAATGGVPTASWILYGGAAAGLVAASVAGVLTLRARDDFNDSPTEKSADDFDRMKLVTNVSFAVAGVAAALGTGIWIASPSSSVGVAPIGGSSGSPGVQLLAGRRF